MIINRSRKFVFVHVPKTGGDSLGRALAEHCDEFDVVEQDGRHKATGPRERMGRLKHLSAAQIRAAYFGNGQWGAYLKIGTMRNPFEQVHSDFHFCRSHPVGLSDEKHPWAMKCRRTRGMTFRQFVDRERPGPGLFVTYLADGNGQQLVDIVLRQERLNEDWLRLQRELGVVPKHLPRINVTPNRPPYRDDYDAATRDLVARRFRTDLDLFGYSF